MLLPDAIEPPTAYTVGGFAALRYLQEGHEPPRLERWVVNNTRWQPMNGLLIPVEGEVTWQLKSGDFTYYRWEIAEIAQNVSTLYEDAP